jgi:hypothetical protein
VLVVLPVPFRSETYPRLCCIPYGTPVVVLSTCQRFRSIVKRFSILKKGSPTNHGCFQNCPLRFFHGKNGVIFPLSFADVCPFCATGFSIHCLEELSVARQVIDRGLQGGSGQDHAFVIVFARKHSWADFQTNSFLPCCLVGACGVQESSHPQGLILPFRREGTQFHHSVVP